MNVARFMFSYLIWDRHVDAATALYFLPAKCWLLGELLQLHKANRVWFCN